MKRTIMSLTVASVLLSGSAMAVVSENGQADNSASTATLNFTGKVTSSLCQVNTADLTKTISLGEVSAAVLNTSGAHSPRQSFTVGLSNCDPSVSNITYTIRDANGLPDQGGETSPYLIPKSSDTSASGVGVFIADPEGNDIQIGQSQTVGVTKIDGKAQSEQSIALTAYIGKVIKGQVTAGVVDATGVMTIKATAASA
ncbi:fimbrial protein [Escherichia albertii]|uniref:Type 1 fimbrial protein n=1 Tax=Escherichia coli TaxID=562 RepID=A0A765T6K6_ECOLX|nr:fimbrial protein [Escherichia albertii]EGM7736316.1 type 1 fimbrial protein [Escherichia albertii]EHW5677611.1 type 1 fimbrial protein [Escherichia albertii]MCZ8939965.1 fimbrial protein [Escherichia albertii]MCZ8944734.1 fimbrial protein [Escherichia albertii]MCZ8950000.1 fimbrial protein [Escherichia albertii]